MGTSRRVPPGVVIASTAITGGVPSAPPSSAANDTPGHARLQDVLDQAVDQFGAPGMVAEVHDGGRGWFGSAGASDTATGRKRRAKERFRVGSTSKTFTATVILQLAAEGKLDLDGAVGVWLPGLLEGNGYDGSTITIRHLLNQTSGIFAYNHDEEFIVKGVGSAWFEHRYDSFAPVTLVQIALSHPPYAAPGERFVYSNTNTILAAMIIEEVTGRPFAEELNRRIVRPLKLTGTYLPGREAKIRGSHPVHYSTLLSEDPQPEIHDATDMNQSFAWAAGGIVSTTGDLNRMFVALLGGHLLPPVQQRELFTTVATEGSGWIPDTRFGLGIFAQDLPCGVTVWGNGGVTYGSWSYSMGSRDGTHMVTSHVNGDYTGLGVFTDVLSAEFCDDGA